MRKPVLRADLSARLARVGRCVSDVCHFVLCTTLWLSGTIVGALGLLLGFVIVAADGRPLRFFAHVQNLSTHYLFATQEARTRFDHQLLAVFAAIFGMLLLARLPGFVRRMRRDLRRRPSDV